MLLSKLIIIINPVTVYFSCKGIVYIPGCLFINWVQVKSILTYNIGSRVTFITVTAYYSNSAKTTWLFFPRVLWYFMGVSADVGSSHILIVNSVVS